MTNYLIPGKLASPTPLFSIESTPSLSTPVPISSPLSQSLDKLVTDLTASAPSDPFLALYRHDVLAYHQAFMANDASLIDQYVKDNFPTRKPRYLVQSGIGGNEMAAHAFASLHNADPATQTTWFVIDSPLGLAKLPPDASPDNTLFLEFSRSGKTEETVKTHEFTPRALKRIVFANSGPLYDLGMRDHNLVLPFPAEVPGRFGRNKTPTLLAPAYLCGLDTKALWTTIDQATRDFDLSSPSSLPLQLALFIYLYQHKNNLNQLYLSTITDPLLASADELMQFWNEGVNQGGNDLTLSRYLGLPRDSHTVAEGLLANHRTKMAIFLTRDDLSSLPLPLPPLAKSELDPINSDHAGLKFGQDQQILLHANYTRFAELMPTLKITTHGPLSYSHLLYLGQLWADLTYCYSRLIGVEPGINPEVQMVRDRSSSLLAKGKKGL